MSRVRYPTLADCKSHVLPWGRGKRDSSVPPWASLCRVSKANRSVYAFIPQSCAQHLPNTRCLTQKDT